MKSDLELWVVLARAYEAVRRHAVADIARHELTPGEFGVLEALYHGEPLLLGELQQKVLVSSGGVTFLVDRLVARGLVERRPCPDDARARHALLTSAGRRLMDRIFPDHARAVRGALAGLGRAEQRRAADLLRTLGLAAAARPLPGTSLPKEQ
ncbi:MAG TPA: MarR family transcriptional regulator [Gemmatimonadales bacterium]|jgi:MarR family 2-MHQ and catechol resistance regulon transcriptional repressor|nr:MarR family transcriptional regulator [Gemmatimonadales bacterium]